jgi:hypothetical protein
MALAHAATEPRTYFKLILYREPHAGDRATLAYYDRAQRLFRRQRTAIAALMVFATRRQLRLTDGTKPE